VTPEIKSLLDLISKNKFEIVGVKAIAGNDVVYDEWLGTITDFELLWKESKKAAKYEVTIKNGVNSAIVCNTITISGAIKTTINGGLCTPALVVNASYTANVTAIDSDGKKIEAKPFQFTTDMSPPNTPSFNFPSGATNITNTAYTFDWNGGDVGASGMDKYMVEILTGTTCGSGTIVSTAYFINQNFTLNSWANGVKHFARVTAYDKAGNSSGPVCSNDVTSDTTPSATMSLISATTNPVTAGATSVITVMTKNAGGVPITTGGATVTFSKTNGTSLSSGTFSAVTDNSDGTYTTIFTGTTSGSATTIQAVLNATTMSNNVGMTVNPGASVAAAIVLPGQTFTNGTGVSGSPPVFNTTSGYTATVYAVDAFNNINIGDNISPVDFDTITDILDTEVSASIFVSGAKTFTIDPVETGTNEVFRVYAFSNTYDTAPYTVVPGIPTQLVVVMPGQTFNNGGQISLTNAITETPSPQTAGIAYNINVYALDADFNLVTTATPLVAITSDDGAAVLPTSQNLVNGTNTFSVENRTAGPSIWKLSATSDGYLSPLTPMYTVIPGAINNFIVSGISSSTTAGVANTMTVTAKDAFSNVKTNYTGTVVFTSGDPQSVLPATYTFVGGDNGSHTFTSGVTLKTAGVWSVTATVDSASGSHTSINVSAAAATTLVYTTFPSIPQADQCMEFQVNAKDDYGNAQNATSTLAVSGYPGTATVYTNNICTTTGSLNMSGISNKFFYMRDTAMGSYNLIVGGTSVPLSSVSQNLNMTNKLTWGEGWDGIGTVSSNINVMTDTATISGRTFSAIRKLNGVAGSDKVLTLGGASITGTDFTAGDEIMWIVMGQGDGSACNGGSIGSGDYGFARVTSTSTSTLTLDRPLPTGIIGANLIAAATPGTNFCRIQIVRVANLIDLNIYASLAITSDLYTHTTGTGGIVAFRVKNTFAVISGASSINVTGIGYQNGNAGSTIGTSFQGTSHTGDGQQIPVTSNTTGGAAGFISGPTSTGGGGAGNAGKGGFGGGAGTGFNSTYAPGCTGTVCDINKIVAGAGGGGADNDSAPGGRGGGIIMIFAKNISGGTLNLIANGNPGSSITSSDGKGAGGGAAGMIRSLTCELKSGSTLTPSAIGGNGGVGGGSGSASKGGGAGGGGAIFNQVFTLNGTVTSPIVAGGSGGTSSGVNGVSGEAGFISNTSGVSCPP